MGNQREINGKINRKSIGKSIINQRKSIGNQWEINGKSMGKSIGNQWEIMGNQ